MRRSARGQYYVNHRWLGGMLTNWKAISSSIRTLAELESTLGDESIGLTKKERLQLTRRHDKLMRALGGIRDMGGLPDVLTVIDTNKEEIAILEARKLGIPVIGVVDSNTDPDLVNYPVPGNDDAIRAVNLYCDLFSRAVIDGLQRELAAGGVDIGASEEGLVENLPASETGDAPQTAETPAAPSTDSAGGEATADGAPAAPADAPAPAQADAADAAEAKQSTS